MWFLTLLQTNFKPLAILASIMLVFYSGWHLRGKQEELKAFEASERAEAIVYDISKEFETKRAELEEKYNNIDTKVTYESTYSCVIPVDGLRILSQATK